MAQTIELPNSCYFSDYFKLNYYLEDILTHFGYIFELKSITLPQSEHQLEITESTASNYLYGAVSMGRIWQFAVLDRAHKKVIQDLELYRVPGDLEVLMSILVAILTNHSPVSTLDQM